jgi:hypothetical protein
MYRDTRLKSFNIYDKDTVLYLYICVFPSTALTTKITDRGILCEDDIKILIWKKGEKIFEASIQNTPKPLVT